MKRSGPFNEPLGSEKGCCPRPLPENELSNVGNAEADQRQFWDQNASNQ